jgi:hypothetical protein
MWTVEQDSNLHQYTVIPLQITFVLVRSERGYRRIVIVGVTTEFRPQTTTFTESGASSYTIATIEFWRPTGVTIPSDSLA